MCCVLKVLVLENSITWRSWCLNFRPTCVLMRIAWHLFFSREIAFDNPTPSNYSNHHCPRQALAATSKTMLACTTLKTVSILSFQTKFAVLHFSSKILAFCTQSTNSQGQRTSCLQLLFIYSAIRPIHWTTPKKAQFWWSRWGMVGVTMKKSG